MSAALQTTSEARPAYRRRLLNEADGARTEVAMAVNAASNRTIDADGQVKFAVHTQTEGAHSSPNSLQAGHLATRLKASLVEIQPNSIVLECEVPSGVSRIQLPPALFEPQLLRLGQPLFVSLGEKSGFRHPVIEERKVDSVPPLDGEDDIDKWVSSLT